MRLRVAYCPVDICIGSAALTCEDMTAELTVGTGGVTAVDVVFWSYDSQQTSTITATLVPGPIDDVWVAGYDWTLTGASRVEWFIQAACGAASFGVMVDIPPAR
ncbi:MAG TPA: hypothetical protein VG389_27160 [Myxococcota bacterium]|nr:hypothetical protein [Myxococcota bacterium]